MLEVDERVSAALAPVDDSDNCALFLYDKHPFPPKQGALLSVSFLLPLNRAGLFQRVQPLPEALYPPSKPQVVLIQHFTRFIAHNMVYTYTIILPAVLAAGAVSTVDAVPLPFRPTMGASVTVGIPSSTVQLSDPSKPAPLPGPVPGVSSAKPDVQELDIIRVVEESHEDPRPHLLLHHVNHFGGGHAHHLGEEQADGYPPHHRYHHGGEEIDVTFEEHPYVPNHLGEELEYIGAHARPHVVHADERPIEVVPVPVPIPITLRSRSPESTSTETKDTNSASAKWKKIKAGVPDFKKAALECKGDLKNEKCQQLYKDVLAQNDPASELLSMATTAVKQSYKSQTNKPRPSQSPTGSATGSAPSPTGSPASPMQRRDVRVEGSSGGSFGDDLD
ncbi:hypothetical protein F5880DRAFT_1223290 [Lentinula raphanica]|nr:hypothetical protein F5880DRAFT_1223290 [Lentinula raphanica]